MTLQKGFLRPEMILPNPKSIRFWRGVIFGLLSGIVFYVFLVTCREGFRITSIILNYKLLILDKKEISFYNLVFSYISLMVGLSTCFHLWFWRPSRSFSKKTKYLMRIVLNDSRFIVFLFLLWFLRLGSLYVFSIMDYCTFSLFPRYTYLFVLLVIVLFLNQWITIQRVYKTRSLKWMLVSVLIILPTGLLLSKIQVIDSEKLNHFFLSRTAEYNLKIVAPEVRHFSKLEKKSLTEIAYFGYLKENIDYNIMPSVFYSEEIMDVNEFTKQLNENKETYSEADVQKVNVVIFIDKDVSIKYFNILISKLIEKNFNRLILGVTPKNINGCYGIYGTRLKLPYSRTIYEYYDYDIFDKKLSNIQDWMRKVGHNYDAVIEVEIQQDGLKLNGNFVQNNKVNKVLYKNIKYLPKCIIELKMNDDIKYGRYLTSVDKIKDALVILRNEESLVLFGKKYSLLSDEEEDNYYKIYHRPIVRISDYYKDIFEE